MKRQELKDIVKKLNINPNKISKSDIQRIYAETEPEVEWDRDDLFGYLPNEVKTLLKKSIDQSDLEISLLRSPNIAKNVIFVRLPITKMKVGFPVFEIAHLYPRYSRDGLEFQYNLKGHEDIKKKPAIKWTETKEGKRFGKEMAV